MNRAHHPYADRMVELARSFPMLGKRGDGEPAGLDPWDPVAFDHWVATHPSVTSAGRHAGRFVLAVWSGDVGRHELTEHDVDEETLYSYRVESQWSCGLFDVVDALACWDVHHREAFLAWACRPWWP